MQDKMNDFVDELNMTKRRGLIVWVYNLRQLKTLKKFGTVIYASRKMKYVLLYVDEDRIEDDLVAINKLHFVRSVEQSHRPEVAVSGDLQSIMSDMTTSEDDFIYNGKKVTPLITNK